VGLTRPGVGCRFQKLREEKMTFLLWTFILIGNAGAIIVLSMMTAGGTSAMGSGAPEWQDTSRSRPA
jgi:hypothetical protein